MKGVYSLAYVETGRATPEHRLVTGTNPEPVGRAQGGGQILRAYVWAAWWTGEPSGKPWRTPDAFGMVPRDGPGCGEYGIDYAAEEKAEIAADEAIRVALGARWPLRILDVETTRIHESFAKAAYRESLGNPPRYTAPKPGVRVYGPRLGSTRPPSMPARDWWATWNADIAERMKEFPAFMDDRVPGWRGSAGVPATHPALVELGLAPGFTERDVTRAYRRGALVKHPDRGGSDAAFTALTRARDIAMEMLAR